MFAGAYAARRSAVRGIVVIVERRRVPVGVADVVTFAALPSRDDRGPLAMAGQ
jgi:hypothetical protein